MKQQLTPAQIQSIDTFVKERYIQYDDVRIEIVDHLATEIEAEMVINSEDSFGKLLWKVGDKYGSELQKLVKLSERKLRWFWCKHILIESIKSIFSWYAILPIVVYFVTVNYSFTVGVSLLVLMVLILNRDRLILNASYKEAEEAQRFLATKAFVWVEMGVCIVASIGFNVFNKEGVWELGYITINASAFALAILMAYALLAKLSHTLLESYYDEHPLIASKRAAFSQEYDNRKWKARKY